MLVIYILSFADDYGKCQYSSRITVPARLSSSRLKIEYGELDADFFCVFYDVAYIEVPSACRWHHWSWM